MFARTPILLVTLASAVLLALISTPAQAGPAPTDLKVYVARVREMYPEAEVTSGFYDWRAVSMYRSSAGLHLGYDIALNAGRAVPAGWSGTVVALIPWTDTEYGICVELPTGYRVTYGHLFPTVKEGDVITAGQFVGTVARDHVDIKVKDGSGGYFDWGVAVGVLGGSNAWVPGGASAGLLPAPPWMRGTSAPVGLSVDALVERYRMQVVETATREAERDRVRKVIRSIAAFQNVESQGLPQAESQMLAWYRAADENKVSEAQVEALSLTVKARRSRVTRLGYLIAARQRDLAEREEALRSARASADATRAAALQAGATEARLVAIDADARKSVSVKIATTPVDDRVREAESRYALLKSRYPGGCSQTDLEEASKTLQRLRVAQGLYELGCRNDAHELGW